jgi:hypothetical protein
MILTIAVVAIILVVGTQCTVYAIKAKLYERRWAKEAKQLNAKIQAHLDSKKYVVH